MRNKHKAMNDASCLETVIFGKNLKDLFEMLRKAKLAFQSERGKFKVSKQGKKVIIEEAEVDDEE